MAKPNEKKPEIRNFQSEIMGTDVVKSIEQDRCASCKGPAVEFTDEISRREFGLSGLCQKCQDEVFKSEEND